MIIIMKLFAPTPLYMATSVVVAFYNPFFLLSLSLDMVGEQSAK